MAGQKLTYASMLDEVGAWLDDNSPHCFTVLETVDGFTVIFTATSEGPPRVAEMYFDRHSLGRQRRGNLLASLAGGQSRRWSLSIAGRQEFLAALGFELDHHQAQSVLIDELDDQLVVTYSYVDAAEGYLWHKHIVFLGPREISSIIETARERERKQQKPSRVFRW